MKYRVEIHVKESALKDSILGWVNSGRHDNRNQGSFTFSNANEAVIGEGLLTVRVGEDIYTYNMIDLYRVKTTIISPNKEE